MKFSLITILSIILVSQGYALLDWETTQVTQKVSPLDESAAATFRFTNIGDEVVTIGEIKSSCGCTTTKLAKKAYAPGETGEITVVLDIGSRQGLQSKTVRIMTDESEQPTILTMKTLIPELISIKPAFLFWKQGEDPDIKSIELKIGLEDPIHVLQADSDNSSMGVQLEEVSTGKHYRLNVFPTSTDDRSKARIKIVTDYPKHKPKVFYVYAHVK